MERCHVAAPDLRSSYSTSKNTQASIAPPDGIVNVAKSQTTDLGSSYHSSVWQTSIHEDLADPMMGDNQGLRICQMVAKCCKIHVSKRSPTLIKNLRQSMVLHLFIRMFPLQVSYQLSCFVDGYIPIVVVSSAHWNSLASYIYPWKILHFGWINYWFTTSDGQRMKSYILILAEYNIFVNPRFLKTYISVIKILLKSKRLLAPKSS